MSNDSSTIVLNIKLLSTGKNVAVSLKPTLHYLFGRSFETATVLELKESVSKIDEFGNIPIENQVYPWLRELTNQREASNKDLLSNCGIKNNDEIWLVSTLSEKQDSETVAKVWKVPTKKHTFKGMLDIYKRLLRYWKIKHCGASMQLGTDVFSLVCSYLNVMIYKSVLVTDRDNGFGKCEHALPHGMITEFKFICEWGMPVIGVMNEENKIYGFGSGKIFEANGVVFESRSGFVRVNYNESKFETWRIVPCNDAEKMRYRSGGHSVSVITVRVNLIDYVLSFWNTDETGNEQIFTVMQNSHIVRKLQRHPQPKVDGMFPIVIDLPKNKNIKWFPAFKFVGEKWIYRNNPQIIDNIKITFLDQVLL
eukprot:428811_1